jgi:cell wall-associated NlpC family hydrolase
LSLRPRTPELAERPAAGVVEIALADLRAEPAHAAELVSQLAFGECVEVLAATPDGRWVSVRSEDGYSGWMRAWALATGTAEDARAWRARARFRVGAPWVWRREGGGPLPFGARLAGSEAEGRFAGPLGPLDLSPRDAKAVRPAAVLLPGASARRANIVRAARSFLGVPYLWGGRSPAGLDCSALVQLAYASVGVALPRDARDQCEALGGRSRLRALARARPRAGDLLFFATGDRPVTHVALATGPDAFLHAYGQVEAGSLVPEAPDFVPELVRTCLGLARAPLAGLAGTPSEAA